MVVSVIHSHSFFFNHSIMNKIIIIIAFSLLYLSGFTQTSSYFNKLIFPQQGTNTINTIIKTDSFYYLSAIYLDSTYYNYTQGFQMIKIDLLGNIVKNSIWKDSTDNISYGLFYNNSMVITDSNKIYVCGATLDSLGISNAILICVSTTLDTLWTRTYQHPDTVAAAQIGANIFNSFTAIRQSLDGGFIISGMYNPGCVANADRKAYLLKTDSLGEIDWIRKYNTDGFYDIELAADSGYYFPAFLNHQAMVFKTDKYGNIQWQLVVNSNNVRGYPMDLELLDSNILYVSSKFVYDITYIKSGITLAKVDIQNQTKLWEKNYIVFNNFTCQSLHQSMGLDILPSGDLVITGTVEMLNPTNSQELNHKGMIMKVNADGDSLWARWHGHGLFKDDCQIHDVVLTNDGGFLAVGWQWHNNGELFFQNAWLLKMDSMGCDTAGCDIYDAISRIQIRPEINMMLYPNPTSDYFRISADGVEQLHGLWLSIIDMQGREVKRIKLQNYPSSTSIDVSNLSSGIYGVSLYSDEVLLEFKTLEIKN